MVMPFMGFLLFLARDPNKMDCPPFGRTSLATRLIFLQGSGFRIRDFVDLFFHPIAIYDFYNILITSVLLKWLLRLGTSGSTQKQPVFL